jgi:CPA1 family monovalent cation:H+ antiporter
MPILALDAIAIVVSLTAVLAYVNHRFVRLPPNIGVLVLALLASLAMVIGHALGFGAIEARAEALLATIDFDFALLHGMLSFLLFAGALHINLDDLAEKKWIIATLATVGVVASTFLVGTAAWFLFVWLDLAIPFIWCLVFGALISPTDPIAVLGILKSAGAPKSLETKIAGESLFNDGVAVVVFLVLFEIATGSHEPSLSHIVVLFVQEAIGGAVLGLVLGLIVYRMLRSVDNYQVEVLLTLALVMGGYALATKLHLSGPVAMVVAGLMIGNHGRRLAMSDTTRRHLDTFWELVDETLNAVLFVLIGLEMVVLTFTGNYLLAGALAIPMVLAIRWLCVGIPVTLMRARYVFTDNAVKIMTWGGLRGGISVALALSLPAGPEREVILAVTYVVVVFSIVVQGLSIGPLIRRLQ